MNQSEAVGVSGESPVAADRQERWRALVDEQRQSGISVSVFCRERSIPPSSFFAWRRKLHAPGKVRPVVPPDGDAGFAAGFTRVKLVEETAAVAPAESRLELRLPGNTKVTSTFDCVSLPIPNRPSTRLQRVHQAHSSGRLLHP